MKQRQNWYRGFPWVTLIVITVFTFALFSSVYSNQGTFRASNLDTSLSAFPEAELRPGMMQSYSITLKNSGRIRATNVRVRSLVDTRLKVLRATDGFIDEARSTAHWAIAGINPGQAVTISLLGQLNASNRSGETLTTKFFVQSDDLSEHNIGEIPTRVTAATAEDSPRLVAFQTASSKAVLPGEELQFNLIIHNEGQSPATGVVVYQRLPEELELISHNFHPQLSNFVSLSSPVLGYD